MAKKKEEENLPVNMETPTAGISDDPVRTYLKNIGAIPLSDFGTTVVLPDNTVDFTPAPGFVGTAQFHYTVCVGTAQCDAGFVPVCHPGR